MRFSVWGKFSVGLELRIIFGHGNRPRSALFNFKRDSFLADAGHSLTRPRACVTASSVCVRVAYIPLRFDQVGISSWRWLEQHVDVAHARSFSCAGEQTVVEDQA